MASTCPSDNCVYNTDTECLVRDPACFGADTGSVSFFTLVGPEVLDREESVYTVLSPLLISITEQREK